MLAAGTFTRRQLLRRRAPSPRTSHCRQRYGTSRARSTMERADRECVCRPQIHASINACVYQKLYYKYKQQEQRPHIKHQHSIINTPLRLRRPAHLRTFLLSPFALSRILNSSVVARRPNLRASGAAAGSHSREASRRQRQRQSLQWLDGAHPRAVISGLLRFDAHGVCRRRRRRHRCC